MRAKNNDARMRSFACVRSVSPAGYYAPGGQLLATGNVHTANPSGTMSADTISNIVVACPNVQNPTSIADCTSTPTAARLEDGQIAGIAVGCIAFATLSFVVYFCRRRRQQQNNQQFVAAKQPQVIVQR